MFSIQNLYGQKILRLSYNTALYNDVAQIEIGNDAFKITGGYFDYLKIKEDRDSMYLLSVDETGNCSAIKKEVSFDNEYTLFNYNPTDTLLKTFFP